MCNPERPHNDETHERSVQKKETEMKEGEENESELNNDSGKIGMEITSIHARK